MAFMMPVMKNNYDIYKDSRSRKTSECSNGSANAPNPATSMASAMGVTPARGRQRMKSESFTSSPSHTYRMQMQRCQSQKTFPRNASKTSQYSTSGALSPTRSFCQTSSTSPPKNTEATPTNNTGSQNDIKTQQLSQQQDKKAENVTIFRSSPQSEEPPTSTFKTDNEPVQRFDDSVVNKQEATESSEDFQTTPAAEAPNSWNVSKATNSDEATAEFNQSKSQHTSLATQLGRRLTAPLCKANIKRCHKKLASLQIHHYHHHTTHLHPITAENPMALKLLSSNSTVELYSQESEASSLCGLTDKMEQKPLMMNMQISDGIVEKSKKSPDKPLTGLRNARRRKRLSFMRRNTKSAPG